MTRNGREYWRSLEQRAGDPQSRAFLEREFPEGASELPEGITRRTMLTLLGASMSMAGLASCRRPVEKIVPYVNAPEEFIPGIPVYYATTMPLGHSAYGLLVESHEGRPTKIEGNPDHPSTMGSSNAVIQASILGLYDPDRSQSVWRGGEQAGWDDFAAGWSEIEQAALENGGAGLAVLIRPFSSPTTARLAQAFRQRFPQARWVVYDPVSDENALDGIGSVAGTGLQPMYHFERAEVVLSLECDFLLTEPENVRHARGFADSRRISGPGDSMSRLYVAESGFSLTGGNADHRLRLQSGQVGALLARLVTELHRQGLELPAAGAEPTLGVTGADEWIGALARDLLSARGRSLVVAGRGQPPAVHAAALALNDALGNVGQSVTLHEMRDAERSNAADLAALAGEMQAGKVQSLVVLGGNPVYDAPADLDFSGALDQVGKVIHLGSHRDETGMRAGWHLPEAHFLEAWGDANAVGGVTSVVQPLIAPLFDSRSVIEVLALMVAGEPSSGHDLVRETWNGRLGQANFESRWNRMLHDGYLVRSAMPQARPEMGDGFGELFRTARGEAASAGDLEIVFQPSPAVYDGRYANNGWLQELPDSVTKLTWDNAALISPATAEALGVASQDLVRLSYREREMQLPVWIVPGQTDHSVSVHLGYGREHGGRLADGRGFNAYALRTLDAGGFGRGLQLTPTGGTYALAQTQDHGRMEGRAVFREANLEEYRQRPGFAKEMDVESPPLESLWSEHSYKEGYQWGMTIDLNACTGCNACVTACQSENNIPIVGKEQVSKGREMHWIRVDRYFTGPEEDPNPQTVFQPIPCQQCENAPCEQVCPVAATAHDSEGLNMMVYNRCIGTRYCANNCPYKVRRFNFFNYTKDTPEVQRLAYNPDVTVRSRGVMEKCTYCTQRINAARIDAKLQGRDIADGDIRTACEQACPSQAITFGNIRDPDSRVSQMKKQDRDYVMLGELNNKPRTSYLANVRNPHADLDRG